MRLSPLVKLFVLLLLAVFAVGCHRDKKQDETETLPVEQLYQGAKDALMQGNETKAIRYYQRLIARFPFGPYTEQSQMELAFAQYKDGKNDEALSTINRFIKTYPTQKNVAYAYYLRGIINFDRDRGFLANWANQDPTKREMASTLQSFEDFSELVTKYPDSRYTPDARLRMIYLRDNMSRAQIYVAKFYYKRGAYVAAVNRAQAALKTYPDAPATEQALFIMGKGYDVLGMNDLRDDAERVMRKNFPSSDYYKRGLERDVPWWKLW